MSRYFRAGKFVVPSLTSVAAALLMVVMCAQTALPQQTPPLQYFKNYFLTGGDYAVGGWQKNGFVAVPALPYGTGNMYASGTISIPDTVQANAMKSGTPPAAIPASADIVAAYLYWQTVESAQTGPAGQTGQFAVNDASGVPITTFTITGTPLNASSPVSWSSGGCSGSSGGTKTIATYRADVFRYLNIDPSNGKSVGNASYTVTLADSGSNGNTLPVSLGASLVLVYRDVTVPTLNAVVIYDGSYAPSNGALVTTQTIQGFYQPSTSKNPLPLAKMTHIVGNGQANKFETVTLQSANTVTLPSLYGNTPPFPGLYNGAWDNPTWYPNAYGTQAKPAVLGAAGTVSTATAVVTPRSNNAGCVSWGAMIFKTDVQDTDGDGLLDVWETNSGLSDPNGNPLPDIHAMNANPAVRDVFIQLDYMVAGDHSHLPSQAVLDRVGQAFSKQGINVHFDVGNRYQGDPYMVQSQYAKGGNAITETACDANSPYCQFPNFPGTVGWKQGFLRYRNGDPNSNPAIPAYFDHKRKDMFHYGLLAHTIGLPRWLFLDGTLVSISVSGQIATITTSVPHNFSPNDFVSISGAPASSNLNGVWHVQDLIPPDPNLANHYSFTVSVPGAPDSAGYTNGGLGVGNGIPRSTSGVGDILGGDFMVTLGRWDNQVGTDFVQASTIMHELGHNLGLGHAGDVHDTTGCKTNYQSVMSYMYQVAGLLDPATGAAQIDYSGVVLNPQDETNLSETTSLGALKYLPRWYTPFNSPLITSLNLNISPATQHCDGTPILDGAQMVRVDGDKTMINGNVDWNYNGVISATGLTQDVNFDGKLSVLDNSVQPPAGGFQGFDDWDSINPRQLGSRWNGLFFSMDVGLNSCPGLGCEDLADFQLTKTALWASVVNGWSDPGILAGSGANPGSGGWGATPGSGGWGANPGSGGWGANPGSGGWGANPGSGGWGAKEQDVETAAGNGNNPYDLTAKPTKFNIDLNWSAPHLGTVSTYEVWRGTCPTSGACTLANSFPKIIGTTGPSGNNCDGGNMFCDTTTKNNVLYLYFVEAAGITYPHSAPGPAHSGPSNLVTAKR